jgi:hypothetical protein
MVVIRLVSFLIPPLVSFQALYPASWMWVNFCSDYFNLFLVRSGDGIRNGQRPRVFYLHLFDSFGVQLEADHFPRQELAWMVEIENGVDDCDILVPCLIRECDEDLPRTGRISASQYIHSWIEMNALGLYWASNSIIEYEICHCN